MSRETSGGSKRKIAAAAAVVTAVLAALTGLFLRTVREQLWQQSIRTILGARSRGVSRFRSSWRTNTACWAEWPSI